MYHQILHSSKISTKETVNARCDSLVTIEETQKETNIERTNMDN